MAEVDDRLAKQREGRAGPTAACGTRRRFRMWLAEDAGGRTSVGARGQKEHRQTWEPDSHGPRLLRHGVRSLSFVSRKSTRSFKRRCEQMLVLECSGSSGEICGLLEADGPAGRTLPSRVGKAAALLKAFAELLPLGPAVVYM